MALLPLKDDNPLTRIRFQYVTVGLIAACVVVFLWQLSQGEDQARAVFGLATIPAVLFGNRTLSPELVLVPAQLTLITSLFLHSGWMHLILNMLFLWIFGDNVEDAMGHWRYLVFYLVCGVIASFAHAAFNPDSIAPLIGASGAISGVLGAYLVLHPRASVLILFMTFIPLRLPAFIVLLAWFGLQFVSLASTNVGGGGVAFIAHIGGFVAGLVLVFPFRRRLRPVRAAASSPPPPRRFPIRISLSTHIDGTERPQSIFPSSPKRKDRDRE